MISRFTSYPVFRITLMWASGILLADKLIARQEDMCLLAGLFVFGLVILFFLYRVHNYRWRGGFGMVASAVWALGGGLWFCLERQRVSFSWDEWEQTYVGQLSEVPVRKGKTWQALVQVDAVADSTFRCWKPVGRKIMLYWMPDSLQPSLACGNRLMFRAIISPTGKTDGLPGFDYGAYLERQGVSGTGITFQNRWRMLPETNSISLRHRALLLREKIVSLYHSWGMSDEVTAVIAALTVGEKGGLDRDLKASYSAAGASHILALSGLHVGILTLLLSALLYPLRWVKRGRIWTALLLSVALWGFAFLSGLSPSVVRAVTMFSLYTLIRMIVGGSFARACAWSLTAFLMLLYSPLYLFDIGFQLSFVAVFAILFFYPLWMKLWYPACRSIRYLWQTAALSISAQTGTLPFILFSFGAFPTYFILTNLVVTPLATGILLFTLLSLVLGSVPWVGDACIGMLSAVTRLLNYIMREVQQLSGAQLTEVYISALQAWLLGGILLALGVYFYHKSFRSLCISIVGLLLWTGVSVGQHARPEQYQLCFRHSSIYLCTPHHMTPLPLSEGMCRVNETYVAVLSRSSWHHVQSPSPLPLDYAYLGRNTEGTLADWLQVFEIRTLIVDRTLSSERRRKLKEECTEHGVRFVDLQETGYYLVPL